MKSQKAKPATSLPVRQTKPEARALDLRDREPDPYLLVLAYSVSDVGPANGEPVDPILSSFSSINQEAGA